LHRNDVIGQLIAALATYIQKRDAFLGRSAGDNEKIGAVAIGEAAIAFGKIGGDGKGRAVQLVGEEIVAARKCLGSRRDPVGQVHGFLVDLKIFEHEGHWVIRIRAVEGLDFLSFY
jgi:hypothetical protein